MNDQNQHVTAGKGVPLARGGIAIVSDPLKGGHNLAVDFLKSSVKAGGVESVRSGLSLLYYMYLILLSKYER